MNKNNKIIFGTFVLNFDFWHCWELERLKWPKANSFLHYLCFRPSFAEKGYILDVSWTFYKYFAYTVHEYLELFYIYKLKSIFKVRLYAMFEIPMMYLFPEVSLMCVGSTRRRVPVFRMVPNTHSEDLRGLKIRNTDKSKNLSRDLFTYRLRLSFRKCYVLCS